MFGSCDPFQSENSNSYTIGSMFTKAWWKLNKESKEININRISKLIKKDIGCITQRI